MLILLRFWVLVCTLKFTKSLQSISAILFQSIQTPFSSSNVILVEFPLLHS